MDIEAQIEKSRKDIIAAETTIALYIEQLGVYKKKLEKMGIKTDDIRRELHKMQRTVRRLQKQEDEALRKVSEILTEIEDDINR